jgi:hypothetical protein
MRDRVAAQVGGQGFHLGLDRKSLKVRPDPRRGWSVPEYKAWLYQTLCHQLLKAAKRGSRATWDLSCHDLVRGH